MRLRTKIFAGILLAAISLVACDPTAASAEDCVLDALGICVVVTVDPSADPPSDPPADPPTTIAPSAESSSSPETVTAPVTSPMSSQTTTTSPSWLPPAWTSVSTPAAIPTITYVPYVYTDRDYPTMNGAVSYVQESSPPTVPATTEEPDRDPRPLVYVLIGAAVLFSAVTGSLATLYFVTRRDGKTYLR